MKSRRRKVLIGLLSLAALQLVLLLAAYNHPLVLAQDGEKEEEGAAYDSNSMIAATGACGIGDDVSVLYVIDTEKKQLAVYYSHGGRDLRFVAARKIFYDLELLFYNDATQKTHSVKKLKELFERHQRTTGGTDRPPRRR